MTRRSRPQPSADTRRRSPDGDPLSEAINAYLSRRQAEELPATQPRQKRGGGWPRRAITALVFLTLASIVLFQIV